MTLCSIIFIGVIIPYHTVRSIRLVSDLNRLSPVFNGLCTVERSKSKGFEVKSDQNKVFMDWRIIESKFETRLKATSPMFVTKVIFLILNCKFSKFLELIIIEFFGRTCFIWTQTEIWVRYDTSCLVLAYSLPFLIVFLPTSKRDHSHWKVGRKSFFDVGREKSD